MSDEKEPSQIQDQTVPVSQSENPTGNVQENKSKPDCDDESKSENVEKSLPDHANYELIDNAYYYTDPSSGTRYIYDQSKNNWVKTTTTNSENNKREYSEVTEDSEGRKYYWAEGMYLCQDSHGNVFYMDDNEWKPWSEKCSKDRDKKSTDRWYFYKGDDTFFRDNTTNKVYKLNKDTNEWEEYKSKRKRTKKPLNDEEEFDTDDEAEESSEEETDGQAPPGSETDPSISFDGNVYTKLDTSDNMTYEWDSGKKAWFPKLDEDFMATYQLSYGFNPDGTKNENPLKFDDDEEEEDLEKEKEDKKDAKKKAKTEKGEKPKPTWFEMDDAHNTKVYVSNLPLSMTEDGFVEFMSKCGLVYKDPGTQKFKVKLYMDKEGNFKGDALCTYIKIESVDLALKILDGYRLDNRVVKVERAKFTLKGEYNPSLKPKKRRKKDLEKIQKRQEKLFDWRPDPLRGQRMKHENVVIFRNVFDPTEFDSAAEKILTHKEAIRAQAETFGPVKKLELFDRHPEGVVRVTFAEVESADMCAATLNLRLYQKRKLFVQTWDGAEKFVIEETEEERNQRIKKWEQFLEGKQ